MQLLQLRQEYHRRICSDILHVDDKGIPNIADKGSKISRENAIALLSHLPYSTAEENQPGQSKGRKFELITAQFIQAAFNLLSHLRPGDWIFSVENTAITAFEQYEHLFQLKQVIEKNPELAATLGGDYIITPDIVIGKRPFIDSDINQYDFVVDESATLANLTPFRSVNRNDLNLILHATISCKWTIRSDRSQNTRTEALNLIRNRKGPTPHIVAVTAEPDVNRLTSLALGTGDLDCVYHFALHELVLATDAVNESQFELLQNMIAGRRIRDISDLPFDLAI